jgi:hypothetical protein
MSEPEELQPLESFFISQDKMIELNPIIKKISKKTLEECTKTLQPTQCMVHECNIMLYCNNPNGQNKILLAEAINKELQKMNISYNQIIIIVDYKHNKEYIPGKPYNISACVVLENDNPSRNL